MGSDMLGRLNSFVVLLLATTAAHAQSSAGPTGASAVAPDLSGYATKSDLNGMATKSDVNAAISASTVNKADAIPTTAPGAGKCKFTWVASNMVQSGGVTGTVGKCSRIVQCGTSATYVVQLFDIGDGC